MSETGPNKNHPRYVCLDGQTFGHLTVLKDLPNCKVLCKCICGREVVKDKRSVKSSHTRSCGYGGMCHLGVKDLTGKTFGALTATRIVRAQKDHNYGTLWECRCQCGNVHNAVSHSLVHGISKSCGCTSSISGAAKATKPNFEAVKRAIWNSYRIHAIKLKISFELLFSDVCEMFSQNCHYCGNGASNARKTGNKYGAQVFNYNGIDRIDSNKGYAKNNVVPCCSACNYAKRKLSYNEFLDLAKRVCEKHFRA